MLRHGDGYGANRWTVAWPAGFVDRGTLAGGMRAMPDTERAGPTTRATWARPLSLDDSAVGAVCAVPVIESHRIVASVRSRESERAPLDGWKKRISICEIAVRSRFAIERRRAEERLRDFAASLEKQVERRLSEAKSTLGQHPRPDGHRRQPWLDSRNQSGHALDLLGWPAHELVGRSLLDFADEEGAQRFRQVLGQTERAHRQVDLKGADQRVHRLGMEYFARSGCGISGRS